MDKTALVNLGWQLAGWAVALLITIGGPLLIGAGRAYLKAHTSAAVYDQIRNYASDVVQAAEQYLRSSDGQAKKVWVMAGLQAFLDAKGWTVPVGMIDTVIESAVRDLPPTHAKPAG